MQSFWLFGAKLSVVASELETNANFDMIEGLFPPGSQSPLHIHAHYSETIYVLEGRVSIYTPQGLTSLEVGDTYIIPKNVPHAIVNESETETFRALAVAAPSGFAKLIRAVGFEITDDQPTPGGNHDMQLAVQVMEEIGDKILGPPGARP
jgi:quercetin dioxygenase-like cupin family protein